MDYLDELMIVNESKSDVKCLNWLGRTIAQWKMQCGWEEKKKKRNSKAAAAVLLRFPNNPFVVRFSHLFMHGLQSYHVYFYC